MEQNKKLWVKHFRKNLSMVDGLSNVNYDRVFNNDIKYFLDLHF